MSIHDKIRKGRDIAAIDTWENEGGALGRKDREYGRRIEADRPWTVHHAFSGPPVHADGETMTGLSRADASHRQLAISQPREAERPDGRILSARSTAEDCR